MILLTKRDLVDEKRYEEVKNSVESILRVVF